MDQAVVLKEWVLAASYREIIQRERKEGKTEAILARVYNLVRERHSDLPASKLSDGILKVAKDSLRESGDIIHTRGPSMGISKEAREGIESWKENEEPDTEDDQDAVSRYLKDGVNPKAVKSKAKSKTKRASNASSHKSAIESASKGKKRQQESDCEDGSEDEGGKGTGKKGPKGKGGRPLKKPKLVVASTEGKTGSKDAEGDGEESEEEPLAKKKSGRKSGSDWALKKLKKDDLIEKIKELQAQVKVQDDQGMDVEDEEEQEDDDKPLGLGGSGKATKKVVVCSPLKEEKKGKGRASMEIEGEPVSDDEGEKKEEKSQAENDKPLSRRSKSPSQLSQLSSNHSDTSSSKQQEQQQAYSPRALPPLPAHDQDHQQKVSNSPMILLEAGNPAQGQPSQSSQSEVSRLRQEVSLNLGRKKALQEELDLVSYAYQDLLLKESNAILAQNRSNSDDISEDPLLQLARPTGHTSGDVTLVDELEEDEHPSKTRLSQVDRMFDAKEESMAKIAAPLERPQSEPVENQLLVKQAAEIEDLRQKLERAAEQADSLKWRLKEANDQIAVEKEKVEANNGRTQSQVTADQHTITALNQDISDLETEKESLERKLELRNTAHDELSKQLVQLQKSLAETKATLDKATTSKRTSEEREATEQRNVVRLQEELKSVQANVRAINRDKENQVAARKYDAEIKKDELRVATQAHESLQLDVINLAVSCNLQVEDDCSPTVIVNDIKTSHLALTQELAKKEAAYSRAFDLASSLVKVLSPAETVEGISLDELLRLLTNKVGELVTQIHKARQLPTVSNDGDLVRLIGDLVVAGGGAETPASLADLPKAIVDIKDALIAKNTVIVDLQGRLHATESDLNEANLSHKTLESSLDQIQGELASSEQRYSSA